MHGDEHDKENAYIWARDMIILDRSKDTAPADADIDYPFALEELLGRRAGEGGPPVCHIWKHPRAFVMGAKDSRLPGAAAAVRWLEEAGYAAFVRNSGGAAVPLDAGVVNVSLIMPLTGRLVYDGYRGDFERMYGLLRMTLAGLGCKIGRGEVEGAYCPGDYDLHIEGFKFCGIAQRRQVRAIAVQAFINVEGDGGERERLVRAFYERAGAGAESDAYPAVAEGRMSSLQERGVALDGSDAFAAAVVRTLQACGAVSDSDAAQRGFALPDAASIAEMRARFAQRYPLPR